MFKHQEVGSRIWGLATLRARDTYCSDSVPLRNHWGKHTRRCPAGGYSGHHCGRAPGNTGGPGTWLHCWSAGHSPLWEQGYPSEWSGRRKQRGTSKIFFLHTTESSMALDEILNVYPEDVVRISCQNKKIRRKEEKQSWRLEKNKTKQTKHPGFYWKLKLLPLIRTIWCVAMETWLSWFLSHLDTNCDITIF